MLQDKKYRLMRVPTTARSLKIGSLKKISSLTILAIRTIDTEKFLGTFATAVFIAESIWIIIWTKIDAS